MQVVSYLIMNQLERINSAVKHLKSLNIVKDQAQIAGDLGYKRVQSISDILTGRANLTTKFVKMFCFQYGINESWVSEGTGMMVDDEEAIQRWNASKSNKPSKPTGEDIRKKKAFGSDEEDLGLIYVPIAAQAGYSRNYTNPVFINKLDRLYIPGLPYKGDKYRYFDVEGDSMSPTIEDGMQVIGEIVEPEDWKFVHDYYIYVIVLVNRILIKRVFKKDEQQLVIISDNDHYPQQLLSMEDIKEMWYVKRILDWRMPPPKTIEITV